VREQLNALKHRYLTRCASRRQGVGYLERNQLYERYRTVLLRESDEKEAEVERAVAAVILEAILPVEARSLHQLVRPYYIVRASSLHKPLCVALLV